MKATELRIGNKVSTKDQAGEFTVSEFTHDGVFFLEKDTDGQSSRTFEYLTPIPLTEEWLLLRFGFSKATWSGDIDESDIDGYVLDNSFWLDNQFVLFRWTETLVKIQYVHQLQNLYYALTGEELTIKET